MSTEIYDAITGRKKYYISGDGLYNAVTGNKIGVISGGGGGGAAMSTIVDDTNTYADITGLEENVRYVYTQPLNELLVEYVPDSEQEAEIQFTAGSDITVSLPADVGIMPTGGVVFTTGASYIINFRNKIAIIASYTPGVVE